MPEIRERPDLTNAEPEVLDASLIASPAAREGPGKLQALKQGVFVRGPANVAQLLDIGANILAAGANNPRGEFSLVEPSPTRDLVERKLGGAFESVTGRPVVDPVTGGEKLTEALGAGIGESVATGPAAFIRNPRLAAAAGRVGIEAAAGGAGQVASEAAAQQNLGPGAQVLASLLAAFGTGAAVGGVKAGGRGILQTGKRGRALFARRIAAETLGEQVDDRAEAIAMLSDELTGSQPGRATTPQVLNPGAPDVDDVAPGVFGLEKQLARDSASGASLRRAVTRIRRLNERATLEEFGQRFPEGDPGAARAAYIRAAENLRKQTDEAYIKVGNIEGIPTRKLKEARDFVLEEAGDELRGSLPTDQIDLINKYGADVDLKTMRRLRTSIGQRIRGTLRDPERATERFFLEKLEEALDSTLDDVATAGGSGNINALRKAIRLRRRQEILVGEKRDLTKIFNERGDFDDQWKKIMGSKRAADNIRTLRFLIRDDPRALRGMQEMMSRHVFGPDFVSLNSPKNIRRAQGFFTKSKNVSAFDAVYGKGASSNARQFLNRLKQLQRGVVGKASEFAVTGSNVRSTGDLVSNAGFVAIMRRNPREAALQILRKVGGMRDQTLADADALLAEALVDPEIAKGMLETLPRHAVPTWQRNVQRFVGRPATGAAGTREPGGER